MDDRAVVARQLGRAPRAFRRVVVRCPFGLPAVTEQNSLRRERRAVSDDVLRHLPVARRRASRGSRPRAASSAGAGRARRSRARRVARPRDGGAADDSARARGGAGAPTAARPSTSESAARGRPRNLKCLHAHAAYALARPGYVLGERILDELAAPLARKPCCSGGRSPRTVSKLPRRVGRRRQRAARMGGRLRVLAEARSRSGRATSVCDPSSTRSRTSSVDASEARSRFASSLPSTPRRTGGRGRFSPSGARRDGRAPSRSSRAPRFTSTRAAPGLRAVSSSRAAHAAARRATTKQSLRRRASRSRSCSLVARRSCSESRSRSTLDERPAAGDTVTNVRTLTPLPQEAPARTVTVTVTVTQP